MNKFVILNRTWKERAQILKSAHALMETYTNCKNISIASNVERQNVTKLGVKAFKLRTDVNNLWTNAVYTLFGDAYDIFWENLSDYSPCVIGKYNVHSKILERKYEFK